MKKFRVWIESTKVGNYRIRYQTPDGSRHSAECIEEHEQATVNGELLKGKRLAKALMERVRDRYRANELGATDLQADLAGLVEKHLDDDLVDGRLPFSRKNKSFALYKFLEENKLTRLGQLSAEVIEAWKVDMVKRGLKNVTVRGYLSNVRTFVHWLKKKEYVKVDYFTLGMMPEKVEAEPRYYVMEEFQALDRVMGTLSLEGRKAINLAHDAGLRKIEIVGYQDRRGASYDDIERAPDGSWVLHLRKEVVKGCKHPRSIPLTPRLIALLGNQRSGPLVRLTYQQLTHQFRRARKIAQLTKEFGFGKLTVHGLRHTFAKNCLQWGQAPQSAVGDMLGHQDPVSTEVYSQFEKSYFGEIIQRSHERRVQEESRIAREAQ